MHEMALCESILRLIEDAAARERFAQVRSVAVEVGSFAHVAPEALAFCFTAVSRGSIAEGARLRIARVPGQAWCPGCGQAVAIAERFAPCPLCGRPDLDLLSGDELRVRDLEVL